MSPAPLAIFVLALLANPPAGGALEGVGEVGRFTPEPTNRDLPIAISPNGKFAVTGNSLGDPMAWSVADRKLAWTVEGWTPKARVALPLLGSGLADPRVHRGFTHAGAVVVIVALPENRFASAGLDGVVRVWGVVGDKVIEVAGPFRVEPAPDRRQSVTLLAASVDGTKLAAATSGRRVVIWELNGKAPPGLIVNEATDGSMPPEIGHLAFAPDGKLLVGNKLRAQVFAPAVDGIWKPRPVSLLPPKVARSVSAFASDSRSLIVGNGEGLLRWDASSGQRDEFPSDAAGAPIIAITRAGEARLRTAHADGSVRLWDFADEKTPLKRTVHPATEVIVDRAAFRADGRVALLVDRAGTVRVYELPDR